MEAPLFDKRGYATEAGIKLAAEVMRTSVKELLSNLREEMLDLTPSSNFIPSPSQLSLLASHVRDTADHLAISNAMDEGQLPAAAKIASRLESVSRDKVPANVWNLLRDYM